MVDHEEEVKHEEQQSETLKKSRNELFDYIGTHYFVSALADKEILVQAVIFMVAGYETTSVLMSFFFYVMVTDPVIQENIYDEIRHEPRDVSEIKAGER